MNQSIKILILMLAALSLMACALKGYKIDLMTKGSNELLSSIQSALIEKGFRPNEDPQKIHSDIGAVDRRYMKDFGNIKRSYFDRKADYSVHVDVFNKGCTDDKSFGCEINVHIYNVYVGNNPKMKPVLVNEADYIEKLIEKIDPKIEVKRLESLTGVPFI